MFVRGVAFGIPLIMPVAQLFSYLQLVREGQTSWDRDFRCQVKHGKISTSRAVLIVFSFFALAAILAVVFFGGAAGSVQSGDV